MAHGSKTSAKVINVESVVTQRAARDFSDMSCGVACMKNNGGFKDDRKETRASKTSKDELDESKHSEHINNLVRHWTGVMSDEKNKSDISAWMQ